VIKGRGREKGFEFERHVSSLFDEWFDVPKKSFWRTVGSGGWVEPGDIAPRLHNDKLIKFPFVVECKFYKKFDLLEIFSSKNPLIKTWWDQLTQAQNKSTIERLGYLPIRLLVFKFNRSLTYVGFSKTDGSLKYRDMLKTIFDQTCIQISYQDVDLVIVPFSVYCKIIDVKQLRD